MSHGVDKFLEKRPSKHYKQIVKAMFSLAKDPIQHDTMKLKGYTDLLYRKDVGEYRIIYCYDDQMLQVKMIGKRNDGEVYRVFSRK